MTEQEADPGAASIGWRREARSGSGARRDCTRSKILRWRPVTGIGSGAGSHGSLVPTSTPGNVAASASDAAGAALSLRPERRHPPSKKKWIQASRSERRGRSEHSTSAMGSSPRTGLAGGAERRAWPAPEHGAVFRPRIQLREARSVALVARKRVDVLAPGSYCMEQIWRHGALIDRHPRGLTC